jgi:hypothetical protein
MEKIMKDTVRTRLMIARSYAEKGWYELAQVQLQLIRKEIRAYKANSTVILEIAA